MIRPFDIKRFTREEDGSLLVFFIISIITVLGIFALTFDMGRRASTQTDMQSFADNVALAAAGELDGSPTAITRARLAAQNVINAAAEQLKAGTGATDLTNTFDTNLVFYSQLPAHDRPGTFDTALLGDETNTNYKYTLPTTNVTVDPAQAFYVGVTLNTTDVNWLFAGTVSNNAPDAAVGALAIAGNSGYTCEVAPLMFCLPQSTNDPATSVPLALDEGDAVQLRTARQGAAWGPGDFGFLDVNDVPSATCDSLLSGGGGSNGNGNGGSNGNGNGGSGGGGNGGNEARWQACLLAKGLGACFQSRRVDIQTGQRQGQETANIDVLFGIFTATLNQLSNDPDYAPGPHSLTGQDYGSGCNGNNPTNNPDTTDFPADLCHAAGNCANGRFGDGNWDQAGYATTNYEYTNSAGTTIPGSFFDFPEPLTRYEYYLNEIERAANGGVMTEYTGAQYHPDNTPGVAFDTWDDYWPDPTGPSDILPIIPSELGRTVEDGLPQCGGTPTADPNRRVLVVAGLDCDTYPIGGTMPDDVPVHQYYRSFIMGPAREDYVDTNGPVFDIFVEIIEPIGGEGGGSTATNSAFREVVQLYR